RGGGVDLHLHRRGVGEGVDVEQAQRQHPDGREGQHPHGHQEAVAQREFDHPVQQRTPSENSDNSVPLTLRPDRAAHLPHPQASPRLFLSNSERRTPLPRVTTISPGSTPAITSVTLPSLAPGRTVRVWNTLGAPLASKFLSRTKTTWQSPSHWTASLGTTTACFSSRRRMRPEPKVLARSRPPGLGRSARTWTVR